MDALGKIEDCVPQMTYTLHDKVDVDKFRAWCRDNLQPGWYVTSRPLWLGGGTVLKLNDDQDFDIVVMGWGPEKKSNANR